MATFGGIILVCARLWLYLAIAMLAPIIVGLRTGTEEWKVFAVAAASVYGASAIVCLTLKGHKVKFTAKFSFLTVAFLWLSTAAVTALPFYLSPIGMSIADAFFESMSGWTTTGSTVLTSLDTLPASILLWRSMLQWFGGVGIISVGLLLLPFLRIGGVQIFQMESSEKSDKPLAQIIQYASAIALSYLALSLACLLAFYFGGMQFPDAVNHMMATVSSGGFSTYDESFGKFTQPILAWIAIIFMLLSAIPFTIYIRIALQLPGKSWGDPQIKAFLTTSIVCVFIVCVYRVFQTDKNVFDILTESTFAVVSIITTTGFSYGDYTLWGSLVVGVIFMLMFVGGCTGSTSGGIKVYRWIILFQSLRNYLARLLHRQGVFQIRYNETTLEQSSCHAVLLFINVYLLTLVFITILLAATGLDILTSFTAAIATLGNVGPGLGDGIGPSGNYAQISEMAKWILSFSMMLGRLEIMAILILFSVAFWRD